MILKIIVCIVPLLTFGYIMYDFLNAKIKNKKLLAEIFNGIVKSLTINEVPNMTTHRIKVKIVLLKLEKEIYIYCKYCNGYLYFYYPPNDNWINFDTLWDLKSHLRRHGFPLGGYEFFAVGHLEMIGFGLSKKLKKHSFTH